VVQLFGADVSAHGRRGDDECVEEGGNGSVDFCAVRYVCKLERTGFGL
jgi:hypothetical protein